MKQEDKEVLLKDLCARLPYGVKFACNKNVYTVKGLDLIVTDEGDWEYAVTAKGIAPIEIGFIKPYLFPLSSMTEEQLKDLDTYYAKDSKIIFDNAIKTLESPLVMYKVPQVCFNTLEWYNKNHFDYRGLIEKGFAIDATNLNIY